VIANALPFGLRCDDILSRFAEIEAFAESGAAIERPVRIYCSGMVM
jgi:ABC-type polysaccharide/polyol phosphate transport system ATPase subunit